MKKYLDHKHHISISTVFMLFLIAVLSAPSKESMAKKRYGRRQLEIQKSSTKLKSCENKAELCYQHYDLSSRDWKKDASGSYTEKAENCRNQIHECRSAYMPTKKDCVAVLDQCYEQNCQGGICADKENNIDLALACMTNQNYFFVYGCMIDVEGKAGLWAQRAIGEKASIEQSRLREEQSMTQALKQQELEAQLKIQQAEAQARQAEAAAQSEVARIQAENERKMAAEERAYQDKKEAEERARKAEENRDPNAEFLKSVLKMKKDLKKLQKHLTDAKSMIGYSETSKKPQNIMWYKPSKDSTIDTEE